MTRDEAKKLLPIIQAFAEGEEVQYRMDSHAKWHDTVSPTFSKDAEWRIKPKPREVWVPFFKDVGGLKPIFALDTKDAADRALFCAQLPVEVKKFREVLDE